ncbi:MAG TPA: DUF1360 domain-containing protein [Chloroflexota bacterium]|nr:DUF1360 domain-containing protein [Chloroflexota bacterium]
MDVVQALARFIFLGAINHQITVIVVESLLFQGVREAARRRSRWLGELIRCHLCFGTWVGFLLALVFRPRLVDAPPIPGLGPGADRRLRAVATFVGDSFAIAVGGRIFNELLGLLRREVAVTEEERALLEEEVEQLKRTPSG